MNNNKYIVVKFGGTSLATVSLIKKAAKKIINIMDETKAKVITVVSAMGHNTDQIINIFDQIEIKNDREYANAVATGEQLSASLMTKAIQLYNYKSISLTGWQVPIQTSNHYVNASILTINKTKILEYCNNNIIPVITGFQGINNNNEITTLGRGGTDTSAVAIACAVQADMCIIYTDVDGIYTADPRIITKAKLLDHTTYEETLENAYAGSQIMHGRSIFLAMKYNIPLLVKCTFNEKSGTEISNKNNENIIKHNNIKREGDMEQEIINYVTCSKQDAQVTLTKLDNITNTQIFKILNDNNINIDMIVQNNHNNSLTFTVSRNYVERTIEKISAIFNDITIYSNSEVAKISIIGAGMQTHCGVAYRFFSVLDNNKVTAQAITTSEIKISALINEQAAEKVVQELHEEFNLDKINNKI